MPQLQPAFRHTVLPLRHVLLLLLLPTAAVVARWPDTAIPAAAHTFRHRGHGRAPLYSAASAGASVVDFEASRKGPQFREDASNVVEAFISPFLPSALGSFEVSSTYRTAHNGVTHIFYQQIINGVPVMNGVGQINLDASDNVISSSDSFWKGTIPPMAPMLKASKVVETFVKALNEGESEPFVITNDPANDAQQMWVVNGKALQLAWVFEVDVGDFEHVLSVAIDATSGSTIQCADLVSDTHAHVQSEDTPVSTSQRKLQSLYRGWGIPGLNPELGDSVLLQDPQDKVLGANPNGWHELDSQEQFRDTRGNNVFAQENQANDGNYLPNGYRPSSQAADGLLFDFDMDFGEDPGAEGNVDAVVTNLFLMNNILHDLLYSYGFDEASGNFQIDNFGRGGGGNDPVVANALDGSGVNNANMYTPSDGYAPRMRMYRWTRQNGEDRPSSLDGVIVAHEYTHGLSNRLTGGPANPVCLQSLIAGGMGEGWSDFVGVMMSIASAADFSDSIAVGSWLVDFAGGIRRYPYSTDFSVNPYTFDDVNRASGVHEVGTVWCTILFEMAADLVQDVGFNEDIYQTPKVAEGGNNVAMQNVIDGMKLQPCNPDFIDARDAILLADMQNYGGAHQCTIWRSFARRGLGILATQTISASESFCVPEECNLDGETCVETRSPTPAPFQDQDLGVLAIGGVDNDSSGIVFIEGMTSGCDDTYGQPAPDVRIAFRLPTIGVSGAILNIDTCSLSTNFDTFLWLLDSDNGLVGSNDDTTIDCSSGPSRSSHMRFEVGTGQDLQPGAEYTLIVDGYSYESGEFGLTISLQNEFAEDPWPAPTSAPMPSPLPSPLPTTASPSPPTNQPSTAQPTPRLPFPNDDEVEVVCDAVLIISRDFSCILGESFNEFCRTIFELDVEYNCGIFARTSNPTSSPTVDPTLLSPTVSPTSNPNPSPTVEPTLSPSASPTSNPTPPPTVDPTLSPTASPEVSKAVRVQFRSSRNRRHTTEASLYLILVGEGDQDSEPIDLGLVTANTDHVVETIVRAPGIGPLQNVKFCLDSSEPDRTRLRRQRFELNYDGTTYTFYEQRGQIPVLFPDSCRTERIVAV